MQQSDLVMHIYYHVCMYVYMYICVCLYIGVCATYLYLLIPNSQLVPPHTFPLDNHESLLSLSPFLFHKYVHLGHVLDSTYKGYHGVCLSDLPHLV